MTRETDPIEQQSDGAEPALLDRETAGETAQGGISLDLFWARLDPLDA